MKNKLSYYKQFLKIFVCISLISISCSRNEEQEEIGTVKFSISDIFYPENSTKMALLNSTNEINRNIRTEEFDNFIMELEATSELNHLTISNSTDNKNDKITKKANISNLTASSTPMKSGVKYRLLIYNVNNGIESYFTTAEVTASNQDFKIVLSPGQKYNWYAYSYNNSSTIPLPSDLNNPIIPSKIDSPLLFTKGTFTLGNTSQRVSLKFEHKIAKIELHVNGQYIFANDIPELNIDYNNLTLTTHDFDLKSGAKIGTATNSQTINNQKINFTSLNGQTTYGIKQATNSLYTSTPNPTVNINIKKITITKSGQNKVILNSPRSESFTNFTGGSNLIKRVNIKLLYKGGIISPHEWAEGNLYYDASDPDNPYKFGEPINRNYQHTCEYYWNWNTLLPRSITGTSTSPSGDPCKNVLPKGEWRTPTRSDFESLFNNHYAYPGENGGAVYFNAASGEVVRFHEAGTQTGSGCTVGNKDDGQYWSSTEHNNDRGIILEIDERGGSGAGNSIGHRIKNQGRTIRCVRSL